MENDVIMKPYAVDIDITADYLPSGNDDAFLLLIGSIWKMASQFCYSWLYEGIRRLM